ncbi:unnamed protein product [Hymenolepis diminuta]|nr:unnamed protein product [Hymenolepis diminuta]
MYGVNSGTDSRPVFRHGARLYAVGLMPIGSTSNSDSTSTQIRGNPSSPSRQPFTLPNSEMNVSKESS